MSGFQSFFAAERLLIVRINLQNLLGVGHRTFDVAFCLVDVAAVKVIPSFVWFELDGFGVISKRFVSIIQFHLHGCALLVNPWVL